MTELKSTRKAYGEALVSLGQSEPNLVVLDAGVSNSTYANLFAQKFPERYFEMYIAEQNMVGVAIGLAARGKIPFISSFAAFLTRAHDQLRMAVYSNANLKVAGSHTGVSIGVDGASQMGLEDIALFRSLPGAVVFYPSDAVSTQKLVAEAFKHRGLVYLRTTREETPIIYNESETFPLGELKTVKQSAEDQVALIGAGITLHEAIKAHELLLKSGVKVRVIDLYCLKPLKTETLLKALANIKTVLTVEDHYPEGGLGELVKGLLVNESIRVHSLAVNKIPQSGTLAELLSYEEIDTSAIVKAVKGLV